MDTFSFSKDFQKLIVHLHRGKENWPNYQNYLEAHLGGPNSRVRAHSIYGIIASPWTKNQNSARK